MLSYQIIRSRRKTISIEVNTSGEVLVRAPLFASHWKISSLVKEKEAWIRRAKEKVASLPPSEDFSSEELEKMREETRKRITERVLYWSKEMNLSPGNVRITSARRRFGSCSSKGNLSFTLFLSLYPIHLVDYVVVHELSHLVHLNHSPAFYQYLSRFLPDWKEREKELKKLPLPRK